MEELVSDIENLDEHNHDVWDCTECESMVDEAVQEKVGELDVNDLMDANYSLWQDVGEEAVVEYKERTGEVLGALDELVQRVLGLYSTVESTDVDDVTEAINYITEKVYGVRETPKPDFIEQITTELPSVTTKCACGSDHSLVDYTNKED
jgi:hypothetical protein